MKHRILFISAFSFRMAEDAPAAVQTHTEVSVPVEHESTVSRLLALLAKGEQWIVDNVEAGLATLENMFKGSEDAPTTADEAAAQEAAHTEAANAATEQPEA
jgi:ABC-type nitrate/sulfonate/bicarbonate transport system substrate-binding protein